MFESLKLQRREAENRISENSSSVLLVFNKIDLVESVDALAKEKFSVSSNHFKISCTKGMGLDLLEKGISDHINRILLSDRNSTIFNDDESIMITRDRHRRHVRKCVEHLDMFLSASLPMDLAAEEIRY